MKVLVFVIGLILATAPLLAQEESSTTQPTTRASRPRRAVDALSATTKPTYLITYKTTPLKAELKLHVFNPVGWQATDKRPCFLTIHGGGWDGGTPNVFYALADYYAQRGMVGISLQYSLTRSKGGITVFDCVKDGRSAVRYLRAHAAELGIDPEKIIVSGGSAGGHVAAGTAMFDGVDSDTDDKTISCRPNALVLYYPVIDTSTEGYGNAKIGEKWRDLSPLHQVKPNLPPTIVFHGTGDTVCPFKGVELFQDAMTKAGNKSELVVYPKGRHGYFLYDLKLYEEAMAKTLVFLDAQGLAK
jgi:acetyl esterase/lipase